MLQAALEAEVTEFLGRDRYQRATDPEAAGARLGYRNGTLTTRQLRLAPGLEPARQRAPTDRSLALLFGDGCNVAAYRCDARDSLGNRMDTVKVIESPVDGYLAVSTAAASVTSMSLATW